MGKRIFSVLLVVSCCALGLWLLRSPAHPTLGAVSYWLMRAWPVLVILAGLVRVGNYLIDRQPRSPVGGLLLTAFGGILLAIQWRGESLSFTLLGRYWFWILLAYVLGRVLWQYTYHDDNGFGQKRPNFLSVGSVTMMVVIVASGLFANYAGRDSRFVNVLTSRLSQFGANAFGDAIAVEDAAPQPFNLPANAQLVIHQWRGDVQVQASNTTQARARLIKRIRATNEEQARTLATGVQLQIRETGKQVEFSLATQNAALEFTSQLILEIPAQTTASLDLDDIRGDVTLRGLKGDHQLRNCGGITIGQQQGALQIANVRGAIQAQDVTGAIKLEQITRDVVIDNLKGSLSLSARGGNHRLSDLVGSVIIEMQNARLDLRNVTAAIGTTNDQPLVFIQEARDCRLSLRDINGTTNINAQRTRIEANSLSGDLSIEGNADAVDIAKLKGQLNIRNENGEINAQDITGNADIETKRDVNIKNFSGSLKVETEFGKITLTQNAALRGDISAESERGHIRLNLPSDIAFRLDANTESGHITAKGFASIATERRQTSLTANYNATASSPMIVLRTVRGNIDLQATGQALKLEQLP